MTFKRSNQCSVGLRCACWQDCRPLTFMKHTCLCISAHLGSLTTQMHISNMGYLHVEV